MPIVDDNDTWELLQATENATHTYLKIGRQLNTCDVQDVAIGVSEFDKMLENKVLFLSYTM